MNRSPDRRRGHRDQAARAALAPLVNSGRAVCWVCDQPITPGQEWDAGHVIDLATGGDPDGPRLPEHARKADCPAGGNRARGARLGNQLRHRPRRRLGAWLRVFWNGSTPQHLGPSIFSPHPNNDPARNVPRRISRTA